MKRLFGICVLLFSLGLGVFAQQNTFAQDVQTAQSLSDSAHQSLNGATGNAVDLENQRIHDSYLYRLTRQNQTVLQAQRHLDALIAQKAPKFNINKAQQATDIEIKKYDTLLQQFSDWVDTLSQ
jgi:hypothetical protein